MAGQSHGLRDPTGLPLSRIEGEMTKKATKADVFDTEVKKTDAMLGIDSDKIDALYGHGAKEEKDWARTHAFWREAYGINAGLAGRYALVFTADDHLYESSDWEIRDGWFQGIFNDHKWLIPASMIVKILSFQDYESFQRNAVGWTDWWLRNHKKTEQTNPEDNARRGNDKPHKFQPRKPPDAPKPPPRRIGSIETDERKDN